MIETPSTSPIHDLKQDEKACFSRVGRPHPSDYSTNFADAQLLQQYFRIILKAQQAIESSLDVINGISAHNSQMEELKLWPRNLDVHLQVEQCAHRMQMHRRSVVVLTEYSRGTNNLVLPSHLTACQMRIYFADFVFP
jgi:hypothetical protein